MSHYLSKATFKLCIFITFLGQTLCTRTSYSWKEIFNAVHVLCHNIGLQSVFILQTGGLEVLQQIPSLSRRNDHQWFMCLVSPTSEIIRFYSGNIRGKWTHGWDYAGTNISNGFAMYWKTQCNPWMGLHDVFHWFDYCHRASIGR